MSWSYSNNPASSPRDEIRFLVGDTIENEPIMQDEEIDYLVATYGHNRNALLFHTFSRVATLFARDIKRSLGPQSEDPTERLKYFRDQANQYKAKLNLSGMSLPNYNGPKVFHVGIHSNPPRKSGGNNV